LLPKCGQLSFSGYMSRRGESLSDLLVKMPWPVSVALGVFAFVFLRWGVPALWGDNNAFRMLATVAVHLAPFVALGFGVIACLSFLFEKKRQSLVDRQTSLETLRGVSWKDFEFLVAEAYRRRGYQVDYSLGKGADGGVDLVLRKAGRISFVQCKQWKAFSVGASVIREQFGIMTSEKADEAIIVTSGRFTSEAVSFAQGKPIQLVDGQRLLELVKQGQNRAPNSNGHGPSASQKPVQPLCPKCGKTMILRTARHGQNAGNNFWGCTDYPGCNGTRDI
jgi:restriction system protein